MQVVRDTADPGADPVELDRVLAMTSDHAEEIFASLADGGGARLIRKGSRTIHRGCGSHGWTSSPVWRFP